MINFSRSRPQYCFFSFINRTLLIQECYRLARRTVVVLGDGNTGSRITGVDDFSVSYVNSHMIDVASAGIEQKVTRLDGRHGNLFSLRCLISGASSCGNAKMRKDRLGKTRAVRAVCQAGAAIHIRVAQKLLGISHDCGSGRRYNCRGASRTCNRRRNCA